MTLSVVIFNKALVFISLQKMIVMSTYWKFLINLFITEIIIGRWRDRYTFQDWIILHFVMSEPYPTVGYGFYISLESFTVTYQLITSASFDFMDYREEQCIGNNSNFLIYWVWSMYFFYWTTKYNGGTFQVKKRNRKFLLLFDMSIKSS